MKKLILLALALLLTLCACGKQTDCPCDNKADEQKADHPNGSATSDTTANRDALPVSGRSIAAKEAANPRASLQNSLARLVPDDAALVIATQQGRDLRNPGYRTILSEVMRNIVSDVLRKFRMPKTPRFSKWEDYQAYANKLGMKPNGDFDAVMYLRDYYAVLHITMEDAQKTLTWFENMAKEESCYSMYVDGKIENTCRPSATESKVNDWNVYQIWDNGEDIPVKVAVHQSDNVLSVVLFAKDHPMPDGILSDAPKPYAPTNVDKDAALVVRWDYAAVGETLLRNPAFVNAVDEAYWEHTDSSFGFVHYKEEDVLCKDENAVGCENRWQRVKVCEQQAAAHCPGLPEGTEYWEMHGKCDWVAACEKCVENDSCYAALANKNVVPYKELLKKLGYTSIGDDVCIQEMKSLFEEYPVSEYQFLASETGAPGFRMLTPLASDELVRDIQSRIVEHAEFSDGDVVMRGFIGFDAGLALHSLFQRWSRKFEYRPFQCSQLRGIGTVSMVLQTDVLPHLMSDFDEPYFFLHLLSTMSFALKDANFKGKDTFHFWGYVQNSPAGAHLISRYFAELGDEDNPIMTHIEDNAMAFATSPYDPKTTPFAMVKDEEVLADFRIRGDFWLDVIRDDDDKWLISDYRFLVALTDGVLDISMLPRMDR